MPVLARTFEEAGLSTLLVTNMPFWAEAIGVPRTFAVEHPFGHILGEPLEIQQQLNLILMALDILENAPKAGTIIHSAKVWPKPTETAIKDWQPETPSPVVDHMSTKIRELIRKTRKK